MAYVGFRSFWDSQRRLGISVRRRRDPPRLRCGLAVQLRHLKNADFACDFVPVNAITRSAALLLFVACLFFTSIDRELISAESHGREPWVQSRVKGTPDPPLPYTLRRVMEDVTMDRPTEMVPVPGTSRWIVGQPGRLYSFSRNAERSPQVCLDMRAAVPKSGQIDRVTFHPNFPE